MKTKAIYRTYPLLEIFDFLGDSVLKTAPGSEEEVLSLKRLNEAFEQAVHVNPVDVINGAEEVRLSAEKNNRQNLMLLCCDWAIQGTKVQTERLLDLRLSGYDNLFRPSFCFKRTVQACWSLRNTPTEPDQTLRCRELADEAVQTWGQFLCAWQKCDRRSLKACAERNFWINMEIPDAMELSARLRQHLSPKARLFGNDGRFSSPVRRRFKRVISQLSNRP